MTWILSWLHKFENYPSKLRDRTKLPADITRLNSEIQDLSPHFGFLRTMITESPRRNILLMNLSLLTGSAFFLPFPVFGICNNAKQSWAKYDMGRNLKNNNHGTKYKRDLLVIPQSTFPWRFQEPCCSGGQRPWHGQEASCCSGNWSAPNKR